jgi:hypothetical protein
MQEPTPTRSSERSAASGLSPKELAKAKLRARAARIARMRKRVIAASLAIFALAFGAIAYDGSTGTPTSTRATASASATAGTTADSTSADSSSAEDEADSAEDEADSSDDSSSSSSADPSSSSSGSSGSAVTTRQS